MFLWSGLLNPFPNNVLLMEKFFLMMMMLFVWFVVKKVNWVEKILGKGGIYILRKFFGVILLAMSVKLIISNLIPLIS